MCVCVSFSLLLSMQVSHYPPGYQQARIVGMGLNEEELKRNPVICVTLVLGSSDIRLNTGKVSFCLYNFSKL